ncbi:PAS domain-containing protein [Streptomyces sp. NPDC047108]|uniref:PAS domain-containing protein n=1 Tax=Streptomyces sp. NPDC047108 TaxID=3155025 RepID=UPI0033F823D6
MPGTQPDGMPAAARQLAGQHVTCMASLDPSLRIQAADADFFRQFGREAADTCGRSLYELLHPSAPALLSRRFARLAEGRRSRFVERVVAVRGNEGVFSGELTGIAVRSETGRPPSYVVIFRADEETSVSSTVAPQRLLSQLHAQILEGVASGASTVQLAARLYLSRQGIEYHVGLMLRRFRVPNRAALVARANSMGMLTVGVWPPRVLSEYVEDREGPRTKTTSDPFIPRCRASSDGPARLASSS